jgi:hypothetical protein
MLLRSVRACQDLATREDAVYGSADGEGPLDTLVVSGGPGHEEAAADQRIVTGRRGQRVRPTRSGVRGDAAAGVRLGASTSAAAPTRPAADPRLAVVTVRSRRKASRPCSAMAARSGGKAPSRARPAAHWRGRDRTRGSQDSDNVVKQAGCVPVWFVA